MTKEHDNFLLIRMSINSMIAERSSLLLEKSWNRLPLLLFYNFQLSRPEHKEYLTHYFLSLFLSLFLFSSPSFNIFRARTKKEVQNHNLSVFIAIWRLLDSTNKFTFHAISILKSQLALFRIATPFRRFSKAFKAAWCRTHTHTHERLGCAFIYL